MARSTQTSRLVNAPREAAYAAFVDASALVRWLPPAGMRGTIEVFEPYTGGRFNMVLTYLDPGGAAPGKTTADTDVFQGRFVELIPNERVVWAVEFRSDDPNARGVMTVTATFADTDAGVRVELRCDDIPAAIRLEDNDAGSRSSLDNLAALLEGGGS